MHKSLVATIALMIAVLIYSCGTKEEKTPVVTNPIVEKTKIESPVAKNSNKKKSTVKDTSKTKSKSTETEFRPMESYAEVSVPVYKSGKVVSYLKEMRVDVDRAWWFVFIREKKPKILFDYFGYEEFGSGNEDGFIVLKKQNTSVVIFNTTEHTTYAIYDAKILAQWEDYQKILSHNFNDEEAESKTAFFQRLQKEFGAKSIVALTTKEFESYFK